MDKIHSQEIYRDFYEEYQNDCNMLWDDEFKEMERYNKEAYLHMKEFNEKVCGKFNVKISSEFEDKYPNLIK